MENHLKISADVVVGGNNKRQNSPATHLWRRRGDRRYGSYSVTTLALDGVSGQCHAPAALYPGERTPGTHCTGG
jgi:hypothetical protein